MTHNDTTLSPLGQAALNYLHAGFSVVPLRAGCKAPALVKWEPFQSEKATEEQVLDWWTSWPSANIGVVTGRISNVSVIDVDGPTGIESFYQHLLGHIPKTRTHSTPHGKHVLLEYHPDLKQGAGHLPGIDVRNDGGYIVAPPSVVDGQPYTVLRDREIVPLSEVPPALLGKTTTVGVPALIGNPDWVTQALSEGVAQALRNNTAASLVGNFHHKNIPADIIEATMMPFAEKCDPPMDVAELRRTIQSVCRYQAIAEEQRITEPPEYQLDGDQHIYTFVDRSLTFRVFELAKRRGDLSSWVQITTSLPTYPSNLYGPRTWILASTSGTENLRRALDKRMPGQDWAGMLDVVSRITIETYLKGHPAILLADIEETDSAVSYDLAPLVTSDGLNIIVGDGGTGKSYLADAICLSLVSDCQVLGLEPRVFRRCLYLDWETTAETHRRRVGSLMRGHGIMDDGPLRNIAYLRMEAPLADSVKQIRAEIARLGIGFIVVDSIGTAIGDDLNAAENATSFANACRAFNVTVFAIGHVGKDASGRGRVKPIGSAFFWNAARNLWEIRNEREAEANIINVGLYHRKANDDKLHRQIGLSLTFDKNEAYYQSINVADSPQLAKGLSHHEQIYHTLIHGGWRTVEELAEYLDITEGAIRVVFTRDRGKRFVSDNSRPKRYGVKES